jgi:hypothetical protein
MTTLPPSTEDLVLDSFISRLFSSLSYYTETAYLSSTKVKSEIKQVIKDAGYKRYSGGDFNHIEQVLTAKKYPPKCIKLISDILSGSVYDLKDEDCKEYGEDQIADASNFRADPAEKIPLIKIAKSKNLTMTQFLDVARSTKTYDFNKIHHDDKVKFLSVLIEFCYKTMSIAGYQIDNKTYEIVNHRQSSFASHLINSHQLPISYYLSYDPKLIDIDEAEHPTNIEIINHFRLVFQPQSDISKFTIISQEKEYLHNTRGFNIDDRGSDDSTHPMDFHLDWELGKTFTVLQFAEGLFRLRSHKWDGWYELYCRYKYKYCSLKSRNVMNLDFDHGS